MTWFMDVLKIYLEEQLQLLIKYYVIKNLTLLKIQNIKDIKDVLLQWFKNFLIKSRQVALLKVKLYQTKN